ncbi:MAG: pyridoxine 5'-phosphate synthase [Phycisphaerae bacterium SM23_33]|jgi:pyridoxine 5-phosphate synthase|nr:MAG: pyridoxine 5'-phosphate synthase [Phycisphaerae bacterium SM23_33]
MTMLSVNVNKVALLRNSRNIGIPCVAKAARLCVQAGAGGITVHPRPDQRHIRPSDVQELAGLLTVEFNIEGNPFAEPAGDYPGFMAIVRQAKPTQCTLVPDAPGQFTSDHGWDLTRDAARLKPVVEELKQLGARVSLFMDPDLDQIARAPQAGADRVELYTESYARAFAAGDVDAVFQRYARAARHAQDLGLGVNAGHDLNLENLGKFVTIPGILEVSIGHALISEALEMGLAATVREYVRILSE